jgi:hypothetical protein
MQSAPSTGLTETISSVEASRILDALASDEAQLKNLRRPTQKQKEKIVSKDW